MQRTYQAEESYLCYTTCTFLTRVTYSVTTVPLTSGRISLGNFETTKYREDNCYFVAKISLIYSNGSTIPAIKYQALVFQNKYLEWAQASFTVVRLVLYPCRHSYTCEKEDLVFWMTFLVIWGGPGSLLWFESSNQIEENIKLIYVRNHIQN